MFRNILSGAALAVIFAAGFSAAASAATTTCVEPFAPAIPNGATATKDQLLGVQDDVHAFLKSSDDYTNCMKLDFKRQTDDMKRKGLDPDPKFATDIVARINQSQEDKTRVGNDFNAAVKAYTAAHPEPDPK